jgi:uncharacterized protein (DUF362 family)
MSKKISRRAFLKTGTAIGMGTMIGGAVLPDFLKAGPAGTGRPVDISVVTGKNYFENTVKAVELLGGMKRFVSKNSRAAVLINSSFHNPGTIVNPTIALAVIKMCYDAGAKEVITIPGAGSSYWNRSPLADTFSGLIDRLKSAGAHVETAIPGGKFLKSAEVAKALLDCDVFIDVPIVKNHAGTNYTGALKNLMGACPYSTNKFFHYGSRKSAASAYEDVGFLSQCIADLNLVRKPNLCVVDATSFVTTNGPFGPGKLKQLDNVVAGTDHILVDALCCTYLGLQAGEVAMIKNAHDHGLGKIDFSKANIKKVTA